MPFDTTKRQSWPCCVKLNPSTPVTECYLRNANVKLLKKKKKSLDFRLTIRTDEALAETHTQAQEEDRCHTAHRDEDNHGWTHCGTQTHKLTFPPKHR